MNAVETPTAVEEYPLSQMAEDTQRIRVAGEPEPQTVASGTVNVKVEDGKVIVTVYVSQSNQVEVALDPRSARRLAEAIRQGSYKAAGR